jgi:hypothetical protein
MREVQLYIEADRVDLFKDESISVTESIKNAKDVAKVFTTFTKQFTLPASKNNNKIFQHYYVANNFDARIKKNARIEINGGTFRRGKIKLDGVDMRNNSPYAYKVTFYGSVVELKDLLGEDKLPSLTALNINKPYSSDAVKAALTSPANSDGTIIPLITHTQRLYYDSAGESEQSGNLYYGAVNQGVKFDQLKYAIRIDKILEAIESQYPQIDFASSSFFSASQNTDVTKLYMWCHRNKGEDTITAGAPQQVSFEDTENSSSIYIDANSGLTINTLNFTNVEIDLVPNVSGNTYNVVVHKNGAVFRRLDNLTGSVTINVQSGTDPIQVGDYFEVFIETYENAVNFSTLRWDVSLYQNNNPQNQIVNIFINASQLNYASSFLFNIASNMPDMKIIDFLSSLFKMFNLVAYIDNKDDVYVEPLDAFYGTNQRDITKYIDINKSQVNVALPYKEIFFKYKDTGSILAEQHLQEISQIEWGGVEYTDGTNISGGIYKLEPDFHHAKYEKLIDVRSGIDDTGIQVGYFVDDNEEPYLGSPLIMYVDRKTPNYNIGFLGRNTRLQITTSSSINMPSNTELIDDEASDNIHFNTEKSEYTNIDATETLFKRFYQSYIENIFSATTRLIKVSAYLPASEILSLSLSDIIVVNNNKYRINSFDTDLNTGKTDFELINYYD